MLTLEAQIRTGKEKPAKLRKSGRIPAVFYGKREASTPIAIDSVAFSKVWKSAGESTIVSLKMPEGVLESLIHDVQYDPLSGDVRHADFYVFEKGHKVEVEVPIEFEGVSPAIKDLGGTLVKVLHALKVEAEPKDLPSNLIVDIGRLISFESQVLAKDIALPKGVELKEKPEEVVALVSAPREEKEEEAAPIDLSAIEVEKKGKEETEESAETEAAA